MKKTSTLKKPSEKSSPRKTRIKKFLPKQELLKTTALERSSTTEKGKPKDRYVILSLSMIEIKNRDVPVFQLKDLQEGVLVIKTALEIICTPAIAFELSKQDLLQVSYFAGNMMVH